MTVRSRRKRTAAVISDGLTKHFGSVVALEDLDLEVREGEIFGYLGPNGAGKSTTLRLMLDFIRPTSGKTTLLGADPRDPETRSLVGYIPGEIRFDDGRRVSELLDYYTALRRDSGNGVDDAYREELCERFRLDTSRFFGELSSGNRRKVALVQAFMHRPLLLLLDEPTAGLDPLLQREFRSVARAAVREGATILLSSHVLHEVEQLVDRVGILQAGSLTDVVSMATLKRRAKQKIHLTVPAKASTKPFDKLDEVVGSSKSRNEVSLIVRGSATNVIRTAARVGATKIRTEEFDLEEMFLDMYPNGHASAGDK